MPDAYQIWERSGVAIVRRDAEKRKVWGEVMLPLPPGLSDGQEVDATSLVGRVHYDGGAMTAEEIELLADRFAAKRCAIDVMHDGIPRGATVVESFRAGPDWKVAPGSDQTWTEGAWIVCLQVHEQDVWDRIDSGELAAFSIQFVVRVQVLSLIVRQADGEAKPVTLYLFSDAQPQFLSVVDVPATGAYWKMKRRAATPPRDLPVVDRAWDAAAAFKRVRAWEDEDPTRAGLAWLTSDGAGGGYQIGDVVDGRCVVVRSRLDGAADVLADDEDLDDEDRRRAMGITETMQTVETVETETAEEVRDATLETVETETVETEPEDITTAGPLVFAVIDGKVAEAPEGYEGKTYTIGDGGEIVPVEATVVVVDVPDLTDASSEPEKEEDPVETPEEQELASPDVEDSITDEPVAAEPVAAERGVMRGIFGDSIAGAEITDALYEGAMALWNAAYAIRDNAEISGEEKIAAFQGAIADFAQWANEQVVTYGVAAMADSAFAAALQDQVVGRAGRKMSAARLKKFKDALSMFSELLDELDDAQNEEERAAHATPDEKLAAAIEAAVAKAVARSVPTTRPGGTHVATDGPVTPRTTIDRDANGKPTLSAARALVGDML